MQATAPVAELLTGVQRAAILVMYLDPAVARPLLQRLDDGELQAVGEAMATLDGVDQEVVEEVIGRFLRTLHSVSMLPKTGSDYLREVLPDLLDEPRRGCVMSNLQRRVDKGFHRLIAGVHPRAVAAILRDEHPQTQAAALALMGPENASKVAQHLPPERRSDLLQRMARLQSIPGEMADDICSLLALELGLEVDHLPLGGVDRAAKVLGFMKREQNEETLSMISDADEDLAFLLRRRMITFEDLAALDDRAIQKVLKNIDREDLVKALKGSSSATRERFLENLSSRAAEDVRESIELMGSVRRKVVEEAQAEITTTAFELYDKGEIFLPLGDEAG